MKLKNIKAHTNMNKTIGNDPRRKIIKACCRNYIRNCIVLYFIKAIYKHINNSELKMHKYHDMKEKVRGEGQKYGSKKKVQDIQYYVLRTRK